MAALLRLLIFGLIFLTAVYFALSWYFRAERRRRMERDWEDAGRPGARDAYVKAGMEQYEQSLRRRLIWLVYIVPVTAVIAIVYVTNYM
ncbi:hypothetical protein ACROSR_09815 [Roseovarius tibetensis]|uniref:hypothetical protein n=1 Tax=Roseovarius tibetensis TaxID=2685897 RepID=UPI003D7FF51C